MEGSLWAPGGVHCVTQELGHDFIIMRTPQRMAERVATGAHREGINACSRDWSWQLMLIKALWVQSNSRGLKNLSAKTMHHTCMERPKVGWCERICKLINAYVVTLHTILLGDGGTCYTEHTKTSTNNKGCTLTRY
eukprot:1161400-Pelagomonas_calceolata.AAC.1